MGGSGPRTSKSQIGADFCCGLGNCPIYVLCMEDITPSTAYTACVVFVWLFLIDNQYRVKVYALLQRQYHFGHGGGKTFQKRLVDKEFENAMELCSSNKKLSKETFGLIHPVSSELYDIVIRTFTFGMSYRKVVPTIVVKETNRIQNFKN